MTDACVPETGPNKAQQHNEAAEAERVTELTEGPMAAATVPLLKPLWEELTLSPWRND